MSVQSQSVHQKNMSEIFRLSNDIADELIKNIHTVLKVEDINFTGGLDSSWSKGFKNGFVVIDSSSPYALPVDRGMPPGTKVSFDALYNWVQGKLGITDPVQATDVTFKIRNKILAKGIKPTRFIKKAVKMFINKNGAIRPKRNKISNMQKRWKKFNKYLKKAIKIGKKFNKGLSKITKFLNSVRRYQR